MDFRKDFRPKLRLGFGRFSLKRSREFTMKFYEPEWMPVLPIRAVSTSVCFQSGVLISGWAGCARCLVSGRGC